MKDMLDKKLGKSRTKVQIIKVDDVFNLNQLQDDLNKWLNEHEDIEIVKFKLVPVTTVMMIAIILYKIYDKKE